MLSAEPLPAELGPTPGGFAPVAAGAGEGVEEEPGAGARGSVAGDAGAGATVAGAGICERAIGAGATGAAVTGGVRSGDPRRVRVRVLDGARDVELQRGPRTSPVTSGPSAQDTTSSRVPGAPSGPNDSTPAI